MSDFEGVRNARITKTFLGDEDHGIFTASLTTLGGSIGQDFGGYDLRHSDRASSFIKGVLRVTGAASWEQVVGKFVRVRATHAKIEAIGHITDNTWFEPERDMPLGPEEA